ncbi:sulfatase-like hydrolase/transferase [Enterovibrio sp. ZSDZ35]|uniref:Sulfatase-like hydrolase/transferase n=1 Tax=Enterovibrio qingdaonensis TaxID=2899818 RepID=A0ABT5QII6_9GAMM|nr:sulfatase-like hydrolase/transferase [Enterovibrio sp. ZSDZ35]MDD1780800.1 sulfatase-like hydrolase/transferase [Enterovibrio sp. ZSDZ35]
MRSPDKFVKSALALSIATSTVLATSSANADEPNIVTIMLDDVAPMDISAYHRGLGAIKTPNIDRIAQQGVMVSDYYAQSSSTAGRAAFITGQYPFRSGLTSVGQPGSKLGLKKETPTLAELLKQKGYATVHVGKSHLGDNNSHLPTVHGFDEYYGFLYHLNVMEMPEQPEFPKDPNFVGIPRNVIHSVAQEQHDDTVDPRFGVVGKQQITDKGALGKERMKVIDEEFLDFALEWLDDHEARNDDQPYFMWFNPSRMHTITHVRKEYEGASQTSTYYDALTELDDQVGVLLDKLEQLGELDNTIVLFTSDNGVNTDHWPDAGAASFRGQKGTTWDGGFRVPMLVSWPQTLPKGTYVDGLMTAEDWLPTLMAATGEPNIKQDLLNGVEIEGTKRVAHLDGYNQLDMLEKGAESNRHAFFFYNERDLNAVRVDEWKVHLRTKTTWTEPAKTWPFGVLVNIKADPYERSPDTTGWYHWMKQKSWVLPYFYREINTYQQSLKKYPPAQKGTGVGMGNDTIE